VNFEQLSLDPRLVAGTKTAGYTTATPIQEQAIPLALQGRDLLGTAQTGTGKTAAFMLPIMQRLLQGRPGKVRALIVAPTRELAEQIHQTAKELGSHTRLRSVAIYGGVSKERQVAALRRGAEIVVACPGRLLDHMGDGNINLDNVEVLVLDEADRMCDMGFLPDIRRILRKLPQERQTLFFSATMPDDIRGLANEILHNAATVQVDIIAPAKTVSHALYPVPENLKTKLLLAMLKQFDTRRVLVFTRTKRRARNLALDLERANLRVAALQGNMAQNARTKAISDFRAGGVDILVATDIAARGIDITEISHVINYDMPDTVDAYTHRIGRTGRAHHSGEAFTFSGHLDEPAVAAIEKVLGAPLDRRQLEGFDYGGFVMPVGRSVQGSRSQRGGNASRRSNQPSRPQGGAPRSQHGAPASAHHVPQRRTRRLGGASPVR
jgi:ATP-dependent RNA helicase RhlE